MLDSAMKIPYLEELSDIVCYRTVKAYGIRIAIGILNLVARRKENVETNNKVRMALSQGGDTTHCTRGIDPEKQKSRYTSWFDFLENVILLLKLSHLASVKGSRKQCFLDDHFYVIRQLLLALENVHVHYGEIEHNKRQLWDKIEAVFENIRICYEDIFVN